MTAYEIEREYPLLTGPSNVLVSFTSIHYVQPMAKSSMTAFKRPPVGSPPPKPSSPAGGFDAPAPEDTTELLGVAVDFERRRGRGAQSNASGRYEPLARIAFDDGWRSLDELPPFKTQVTVNSTRKIIPRNQSP